MGECFWNTAFGIDWWNLLGGKNEAAIILQCRTMIASRDGVTKINAVTATLDSRTRQTLIAYHVDDIFSKTSQGTVAVP